MQDTAGLLDAALAHHQAGRLAEAKALYARIIAQQPKHPDALHFTGLLACQVGQSEAGIALMRESIAIHANAIYYNNLGNALREARRLDDAIEAYRRALELDPRYADAHNNLGTALCEAGEAAAALTSCTRAIELQPGYAQGYNNLGNALKALGEFDAAILAYGRAIDANPACAEAHLNLGVAMQAKGYSDAALESVREAIALAPQLAAAHDKLAGLLMHRGDVSGAIGAYRRAVELAPASAQARNALGNALNDAGRAAEAVPHYERAIALEPDAADAYHNLSSALRRLGAPERALSHARRAVELRGDMPSYRNNLGMILADLGEPDAALVCYRDALALDPEYGESHTCVLFGQAYASNWSARTHLDDARYFGERISARATPYTQWPALKADAAGKRPLRVGFVSADLRKHPVGYFFESILAQLDPARIEPVAYSNALHSDELTARLQPRFALWRHVAQMDDVALAQRVYDDRIDVLVDLSGHTGRNRLPMFAWRPAPLQVSWLGYFATTGLARIDYLLADRHVVPPCEESQYVERIWRLPDSYLCFTLPAESAMVAPLPALTNGYFTFGCLNNHKKLNDGVLAAWSRILHAVPRSKLLLKNHQLGEPSVMRETFARLAMHGIDGTRLLLEGPSSREQYFGTYGRIDLALDPFPYPGGTTSVEGLWMGVPVLTRAGDRFLSHLGELVMKTVGLHEWIAADTEDYVARAIAAAGDLPGLSALRAGLRERLEHSPLADAPRFAANWMTAIERMWQTKIKEMTQ